VDSSIAGDATNSLSKPTVTTSLPNLSDKASFDCTKVGRTVAKILCGSHEGAMADWDLNSTLWAIAGMFTEAQQKAFDQNQDRWRTWLNNKCLQPMPVANDISQEQQRCVIREFHSRAELLRSKLAGDLLSESRLSPEQHAKIQEMLIARGLLLPPADGEFGNSTRQAIRNFQGIVGVPLTGFLSREQAGAVLGAPINLGGTREIQGTLCVRHRPAVLG
jgi:Putative peptidoglycan binding domain